MIKSNFVRDVYRRLNLVITQWAMDNYDNKRIRDFSSVRNLYDNHDYWGAKLVCCNGYNIVIRFDIVEATSYKHTKMLTVYIEKPCITPNYFDDKSIGTNTEYNVINKRTFVEGQFDIEDQGWINSIITFIDRYVNMEDINVESLL